MTRYLNKLPVETITAPLLEMETKRINITNLLDLINEWGEQIESAAKTGNLAMAGELGRKVYQMGWIAAEEVAAIGEAIERLGDHVIDHGTTRMEVAA